jgi:hypothetical protein
MKSCSNCGHENAAADVYCRECGNELDTLAEAENTDPDRPRYEAELEDEDERAERPDIYDYLGTYSNEDARLLLDAFISAGIDYTLNVNEMGVRDLSALQASQGGTFGAGIGIAIGVHTDDCQKAMMIRQRVLKIML